MARRAVAKRTGRSDRSPNGRFTIGLLVSDVADVQAAEVWSAVVAAARKQDANLVCFGIGEMHHPELIGQDSRTALSNLVSQENVDGLVTFAWWRGREWFEHVYERFRPLPVVNVMRLYEGYPGVGWDNAQVTRDLVSHLVSVHGCRRIAYIGTEEGNLVAEERYRAYVDTLKEHGIELDPQLVKPRHYALGTGVRYLLDECGLQPGADVDAVVAYNDADALQALADLHSRGVRVPQDIAVAGIDNIRLGAVATPPLTTVAMPRGEMAARATELLLALLRGEDVPDQTRVKGELVVRRSCGCLDPAVVRAAADVGRRADAGTATLPLAALGEQRGNILAAIAREAGTALKSVDGEVERLLDAFWEDLQREQSGSPGGHSPYLFVLDRVLRRADEIGDDVGAWQDVLSAMRKQMLPYLAGDALSRAEDLWQQGRVSIGMMAQQAQARRYAEADQQAVAVRAVAAELLNVSDVPGLADVLTRELPQLGIPSCYLSLYDDPGAVSEQARLVMAYGEQGRVEVEPGGRVFPSQQLVPVGMLSRDKPYSVVIEHLYSGDQHLGFIVFEVGPTDGSIYETLREEISSVLWRIHLSAERQRTRAALAQEEALLRALLDNVPDHVYFKDLESRFIRVSKSMADWFGLSDPEELIGKSDFDFFTEDHARPAYEDEQQIIRTGQSMVDREERETWPDRPDTWVSTTKMPLLDESGEVIGTFGISRDITARKRAEGEQERLLAEVRQSEELLRSIIDATPDWIFVKDREHRFRLVNQSFAHAFGLQPEDFVGKDDLEMGFWEFKVRGDPERGIRGYWADDSQVMDTGETLFDPHDVTTIDGKVRVSNTLKIALRDAEGNVWGVLAFVRDVTEREALFRDLERRTTQLQTAAEVSRAAGSILDPDELIRQAVDLVHERFGFYYVGLFLADETAKWAVLQAGTGDPGRQMVERGHRLEVGGDSMIGQCVARGEARIALDVGEEARRFDNPLLPETRSEMALPLVSRGQTIGAMTIQSEVEAAFSDEDIASLQTMADQLAVAIGNARLFEETQLRAEELAVLNEMSRVLPTVLDVGEIVQRTYRYASRLMDTTNFYIALYDEERDEVSFPIYAEGDQIRTAGSRRAGHGMTEYIIHSRQPLLLEDNVVERQAALGIESIGTASQSWLGVPMMVGDRVVGVAAVQSYTTPRVYDERDRDLLSAIASQAAVVIENARLLQEAQTRAVRERTVRTITDRISRGMSREEIVRIAVDGLGSMLGATTSIARLGTEEQLLQQSEVTEGKGTSD
jgi:PAS domain S-box-containing protein